MARTRRKQPQRTRRVRTSSLLLWVGAGSLLAAVVVIGFLAFGGGDSKPRSHARQTPVVTEATHVTVDAFDNDYSPRDLTVPLGATVDWKLTGDLPHTITDDQGRFDSGTLSPGDTFRNTFEASGTYRYYCTLHHAMLGTLVVRE